MFQIEPILWLRDFASPGMDLLMTTVSKLGYSEVYGTVMFCLIFGYQLKKGLAVMVAAFLVGLLTFSLKNGLAFPRPSDIDIRVLPERYEPPFKLAESGTGKDFWDLPSMEARQVAGLQQNWSYGLPSGHVSSATVFLLGIALFFRSRTVFWLSMAWIPLMCLSRMYLGRHFLADVVGGVIVGLLGIWLAHRLLYQFHMSANEESGLKTLTPLAILVLPLVILTPFVELIDDKNTGRILAMLVFYGFLIIHGLPSDNGKFWYRASRVIVVIVIYVIVDSGLDLVLDAQSWGDLPVIVMMNAFLINVFAFVGGVLLSKKVGLYRA